MTNRVQVLQLYRLIRVLNPKLSTTLVLSRMSGILPQWPIHEWGPCFGCEKTCCMPALCEACEKACLSENIAAVGDAIASVPPPEQKPIGVPLEDRVAILEARVGTLSLIGRSPVRYAGG